MGKRFLRTIVRDQTTLSATGDISAIDLPVNPLSFLVLTIGLERPDEDATSAHRIISDCFLGIGEVSVRHKGEMILQGTLADLTMLNGCLHNYSPHGAFMAGLGQEQMMSFVLAFTRQPYWPEEAFPATSRGNLQFILNVLDTTPGTATAMSMQLEACELIESDPKQYIKYTTNQRTMTATGRQRTSLPIGNELAGCLLFNPATEITTTEQSAWGKVKVLVDNVEQYYAESNWEALRADLAMRLTGPITRFGHMHASDGTAVPTGDELLDLNRPPVQYGWLDFDPLKNDFYLLETAGHADVDLDMNSDVSSGTARYLPVELVRVRA
jgi:hypothetical protein